MNIVIIGGGSFGTALANQFSYNENNSITIYLRNKEVEKEINNYNTNSRFFPNRKLNDKIKASSNLEVVKNGDVVIIAIPSKDIPEIVVQIKPLLSSKTLLVNTAKGLMEDGTTLVDYLIDELHHENTVTLKGPSFSNEMIDRNATLLTLGFSRKSQLELLTSLVKGTNVYLDYTTDIRGVEFLSAVKNIYAIFLGTIDAKFNSANTRFLFLTKAISEIKIILSIFGGKEETLLLGCGFGDICLTSLSDQSRNRTLGLLIGKGFYNTDNKNSSIVLEGIKALHLIDSLIVPSMREKLPLLQKVIQFFIGNDKESFNLVFESLLRPKFRTVITYGSFDLLHYGHLEILRRAKDLGDKLIVGLSTDEFNKSKGKISEFSYQRRKQFLESLHYVDLVIPEENWSQKVNDIEKYGADFLVMGDDWKGKFDDLKSFCEVVYFPRTKGISTTAIKNIILKSKTE